jgi:hypothetical protein
MFDAGIGTYNKAAIGDGIRYLLRTLHPTATLPPATAYDRIRPASDSSINFSANQQIAMLATVNQLSLVPLGAGDLIDRAVRLYRRHFMTLIRIAAPPTLITMLGSLLFTVGVRSAWSDASKILLVVIGFLIQVGGILLNLIVIGGAARNLITHLLWNEPFSARTTYHNVRARFGSLLGAAIIIAIWIFLAFVLAVLIWAIAIQLVFATFINASMAFSPWVATLIGILGMLIVTLPVLVGFFFLVKFIAYVPQVLMIEGRGVFESVGRSFTLARGNLRRLMAMFLFYWFAAWSALTILLIPLLWYGHAQGINIMPNKMQTWPMWYQIGYSVLTQMSTILLVPVLMLGLSLMYVDERVRQEGYDVELIAARQLMMPNFYGQPSAPYRQTAVGQPPAYVASPAQYNSPGSTLGLR